jgi:glutamate/aspartate transport system substrate-binding protein
MLPKDDAAFKKVVDGAVGALFKSPEGVAIYNKWFTAAIPPKGLNLNVPMSAQMKKIYAAPSDSPDPAAY